jgi:hypothetical protein
MMGEALEYLIQLIHDGVEYPDAEYKAVKKYGVSADELRACYDAK